MNPMEELRTNISVNLHMYHGMQRLDMCPLYVDYTDVPCTVVHRSMGGMPVFPDGHNKNWHLWVDMTEHCKGTIHESEEWTVTVYTHCPVPEEATLFKNLEGMWPARLSFDWRFTTPRPIILRWGHREGGSIDNKAQWKCGSLRQAADIIREKLEIAVNIVINNSDKCWSPENHGLHNPLRRHWVKQAYLQSMRGRFLREHEIGRSNDGSIAYGVEHGVQVSACMTDTLKLVNMEMWQPTLLELSELRSGRASHPAIDAGGGNSSPNKRSVGPSFSTSGQSPVKCHRKNVE